MQEVNIHHFNCKSCEHPLNNGNSIQCYFFKRLKTDLDILFLHFLFMLKQVLFQNKQLKFFEQKTPLYNQRSSARGCESRSDISALSIDPLVILVPPLPPLLFDFIVPVVEYKCVVF